MNTIKIYKKKATCTWKKVLDKILLLVSLDQITDLEYLVEKKTFYKVAKIRQEIVDLVDEILAKEEDKDA